MNIQDYEKGFEECADLSLQHFKSAELLAKESHYNIALGHIVIGAEESIKAMVYYSYIVDFLNIEGTEGLFKDHATRHKLLSDVHWIWRNLIDTFINSFNNEETRKILAIIDAQSINDERRIRNWWKKANKLKNKGWYVTYSNGNWMTPKDITKEDVSEAQAITLFLKLSTNLLLTMMKIEKRTDGKTYE